MRVLVACEFSGIVRDAFRLRFHDAWSCDLLPTEKPGPHIQNEALFVAECVGEWDMMVVFPPCTHLANSGARWFPEKRFEQIRAIHFCKRLMTVARIPRIAMENPIGVLSTHYRKPDQIIQPWQYGHGETKATCLWLKGLPLLEPTDIVDGRVARVHHAAPGPNRWKERSRTLPGIAAAMAAQWGAA